MGMNSVPTFCVWQHQAPDWVWTWLTRRVGITDSKVKFVVIIQGSSLQYQLFERIFM